MNTDNLTLARKYLGLNQKQFAERVNVSQALISQIENGIKPITPEIIEILSQDLGESFFFQKPSNPNLKVHYRVSSTISKTILNSFEARIELISNNLNILMETVDIPDNKIPTLDLEDFELDAKYVANEVRTFLGLGRNPVGDLIQILERNGVVVHFYDFDFISEQNKTLDGVSFIMGGVPVILVNSKIQNARKYFTIAHELGHIVMHLPENVIVAKNRDIEKEANEFASEFLVPTESIREDLFDLSQDKLLMLKHKWKISASALLFKAKDISLTYDQYRRWVQKTASWRKREPMDFDINKPVLLKTILEVCKNEFNSFEALFNQLGINKNIFQDLYGQLFENNTPKLKIVI